MITLSKKTKMRQKTAVVNVDAEYKQWYMF